MRGGIALLRTSIYICVCMAWLRNLFWREINWIGLGELAQKGRPHLPPPLPSPGRLWNIQITIPMMTLRGCPPFPSPPPPCSLNAISSLYFVPINRKLAAAVAIFTFLSMLTEKPHASLGESFPFLADIYCKCLGDLLLSCRLGKKPGFWKESAALICKKDIVSSCQYNFWNIFILILRYCKFKYDSTFVNRFNPSSAEKTLCQ